MPAPPLPPGWRLLGRLLKLADRPTWLFAPAPPIAAAANTALPLLPPLPLLPLLMALPPLPLLLAPAAAAAALALETAVTRALLLLATKLGTVRNALCA
jgi:hypothetical protein